MTARDTVTEIAKGIISRAEAQGWKGKKGNELAMEAAIGGLNAAIAIYGNEHDVTKALSMFAFLTSTRGLAHVRERAAWTTEEAKGA